MQISDDEDDVHPNVDTPSLFRWRHEARVERMREMEEEKAKFQKLKDEYVFYKLLFKITLLNEHIILSKFKK